MKEEIFVKGAKENNLKNIDVHIPRNQLVVFTGVSGSGKSTLAFQTIFAEGQRRYVESLSAYARQFLGQMEKPNVESIEGLSPAISIDQKTTSHNPRSTVGTVTEIYDYLRLLFARIGVAYCPKCGKKIERQTIDQIADHILEWTEGTKLMIEAPVVRGRKGEYLKQLDSYKKAGYARVKIDGQIFDLQEQIKLEKNNKHTIHIIIDRLILRNDIRKRLVDSLEQALALAGGLVVVSYDEKEVLFSTKYACPDCNIAIEEIEPRLFSFNTPYGACPTCSGIGYRQIVDENLLCPDKTKTLAEGAIKVGGWNIESQKTNDMYINAVCKYYNIDQNIPVKDLPKEDLDILMYGNNGEKIDLEYQSQAFKGTYKVAWEGFVNALTRRYQNTESNGVKADIERYITTMPCQTCKGQRLKKEALSIKIADKNIAYLCELSITDLITFFHTLQLTKTEHLIADVILKEIVERLQFLHNVGLGYLNLSRMAGTLSGGESQRIRLATQIGSGLTGVLYILDEPSIGLHQRDNEKLLQTLHSLRDLGNTLIVVEHDEDTIRSADMIVDIGPKAGVHGGNIVAYGSVQDIMQAKNSLTGDYLSGRRKIEVPTARVLSDGRYFVVTDCHQNNLKHITAKIPVGLITAVTGVSGSGKSSLVNEVIYPILANHLNGAKQTLGKFGEYSGLEYFDKVIAIDQSPIGRTPRSNPATYTGVFTMIRELFAATQEARERGYKAGRFSFNVAGGRCEHCQGDGIIKIEMHFLPDVFVPCEICHGNRYNRETLEVQYKGKNIAQVLDMTIEEACQFFENIPSIYNKLKTIEEVGLGYIKLGQSATTLSGGEAQRVKLATELSKRSTGKTIYILDEPTTGLHTYDVHKLITILQKLRQTGNTVVVIEHNLDVIKIADYILDLGKEGGSGGGEIVVSGTPEEVANCKESYTGKFLKPLLSNA